MSVDVLSCKMIAKPNSSLLANMTVSLNAEVEGKSGALILMCKVFRRKDGSGCFVVGPSEMYLKDGKVQYGKYKTWAFSDSGKEFGDHVSKHLLAAYERWVQKQSEAKADGAIAHAQGPEEDDVPF